MALYISTADGLVWFITVNPYWERSGMALYIATADGLVGCVDPYLGRSGKVWR